MLARVDTARRLPAIPINSWPPLPADILGFFTVALGMLLLIRPPLDPDLGWHLRNGQAILVERMVSSVDQFSYSMRGASLNNFEWLWDVMVAILNRAIGPLGLVSANIALLGTTLACVYLCLRIRRLTPPLAGLGTVLALLNVTAYDEVRPGMVGALMISVFILMLELWRRDENWRLFVPLAVLEVIWANCHASFVLGPVLCGIYALVAAWERRRNAASALALASVALTGLTLLNPAGFNLLRFTVTASRLPFNRDFVAEWMPPNFHESMFRPLMVTLLLSVLLPLLLRDRRPEVHRLALLLVGTVAVLQSVQFLPLYAVAGAPVLAEMIHCALTRVVRLRLTLAHGLIFCAVLFGIALPRLKMLTPTAYHDIVAARFPVGAVGFIKQHRLEGPMWNDFDWGSYLLWALPGVPVFIDGRAELYGQEFLHKYVDVASGIQPPDEEFKHYGIRLAVIPVKSALATELRLRPAWREAFHDNVASVFVLAKAPRA